MKLGIVGASGRMGQTLIKEIVAREDLELAGASDHENSPLIGKDISLVTGGPTRGIKIESSPFDAFIDCQAIIDFSTPKATLHNAEFAAQARIVHVIGTTGLNSDEKAALKAAARHATIIQSGNMSLGINLLEILTQKVAQILGAEFDIEITEAHHRHKVDAPSGTALMLGEAAAKGRGVLLSEVAERGRDGISAARQKGAIGFSSIRGGDIIGMHDVLFAGDGEMITLKHQATDRKLFANGALRAAIWGRDKSPGLYNMHDVLGANLL